MIIFLGLFLWLLVMFLRGYIFTNRDKKRLGVSAEDDGTRIKTTMPTALTPTTSLPSTRGST
jgi:hypothetical protein